MTAPWLEGYDLSQLRPQDAQSVRDLLKELWTFTWVDPSSPEAEPEGEIDVVIYDTYARLELLRWVHDTREPGADPMCLRASTNVEYFVPARQQIRDLIHYHLKHEADECMDFGGERPFWPHDEDPWTP